ncbi:MAG TPA: tRNA-dihydrouridine synthase [Ideonella sp.]|uniref:tRNA dihydrouridine synthase n=1 Tax=Ideonella sp. TaxID=1929293 RepID=UPI002C3F5B2D|nr:tRNA-dihydrouridine synthase [Ideonella sp.]HSI52254.1 tRNA-dihydrouridine synthase [Ideonella sp.]
MNLLLAPMEGLLDFTLRDVLTRAGGIHRCVSEFIRITDMLLPERVYERVMPELANGGFTPVGIPVRGQLLGSDPACLADNAARLVSLSPHGVDLNFGCPAKIVNRHGGGASLLDDPELLHRILAEVRRSVPAGTVVSAKMRLGTQDDSRALDCARALADGGAMEIVVHGRTKLQGYRPPAYWARIGEVREAVKVPVIANGEIWRVADARRCLAESGCRDLMLGRGQVADPGLALAILHDQLVGDADDARAPTLSWPEVLQLFAAYWDIVRAHIVPRYQAGRLKQWLQHLRRRYPEAERAYQALRTEQDAERLATTLLAELPQACLAGPMGAGRYTAGFAAALPHAGKSAQLPPPESLPANGRFLQGIQSERHRGVRPEERAAERAGAAAQDA